MKFRPALCGLFAATLSAATLPALTLAHADLYHAVESGDSLASIARRYGVSADTLRTANRLNTVDDNTKLGAMLLRVPDAAGSASNASSIPARTGALSNSFAKTSPEMSGAFTGSITRSMRHTVAQGETLESIAAAQAQKGVSVSPDSIRARNNIAGQPAAGSVITIPLTTVYRAPASKFRTVSSENNATALSGGAQLSGEMPLPTAREIPSSQPIYQAPNAPVFATPRPSVQRMGEPSAQRGPTSLSSRTYSPTLDGVRVLGKNEEAANIGATPRPRVRTVEPQVTASPSRIATVAKIAVSGARIRRLPDSDAATLYRCAPGTEIAVLRQTGDWSAILMSDKSTGWIPTRYLRLSSQQVDISSIPVTEGTYARRVNKYAYAGNFSSSNPIVAQALTYLGTPYVYGGTSRRGIDCSSLVQHSFASNGARLPRTAAQQARVGQRVDPSNLREGDRLYFSASGTRVDHTGLYMGNGLFVHASGSGRRVIVSNLFDRRNWNIFVGARR